MLVEFSVKNHRSIREGQTFSMVAGDLKRPARPCHVADTGSPVAPRVLRNACLLGPNGAGTTSLVEAMGFMSWFVRTSFRSGRGDSIKVEPFLFDPKWRDKPSEFEVHFLHNENLYQYGFAVSKDRVLDEWLYAWANATGRQRSIFTRKFNRRKRGCDWKVDAGNVRGQRRIWQDCTRPNALFLSSAVSMNAQGDIKDAHDWIVGLFRTASDASRPSRLDFAKSLFKDSAFREEVRNFLREAGIALSDIRVERRRGIEGIDCSNLSKATRKFPEKSVESEEIHAMELVRKDSAGDAISLPLERESFGTRALFDLAEPIMHALERGGALIVDELNLGLHPTAVRSLIALFCNSRINGKNAQLIFTTHDPTIVDQAHFARDQVWLLEKRKKDLATSLIRLSDFDEDDRSFADGYLQGRYGVLPRVWRKL